MADAQNANAPSIKRINLQSLTILRGPAALIIFILHSMQDTHWIKSHELGLKGYVGVSLFYVLSGFVIAWSFSPQITKRNFYLRRFARIYPLHVLFLLATLLVPYMWVHDSPVIKFLAQLFLVQSWIPSPSYFFAFNSTSWSLSCEFFFYLMAPFILHRTKLGEYKYFYSLIVYYLVVSGIGAVMVKQLDNYDLVAYANPFLRSGEFALGLAGAILVKNILSSPKASQITFPKAKLLFIISILITILVFCFISPHIGSRYILGVTLAPVFLLLVASGAVYNYIGSSENKREPSAFTKFFVLMGEVSFAFYLVHETTIFALNKTGFFAAEYGALGFAQFVGAFLLSLGIATVAHLYAELPLQKYLTRKFTK